MSKFGTRQETTGNVDLSAYAEKTDLTSNALDSDLAVYATTTDVYQFCQEYTSRVHVIENYITNIQLMLGQPGQNWDAWITYTFQGNSASITLEKTCSDLPGESINSQTSLTLTSFLLSEWDVPT